MGKGKAYYKWLANHPHEGKARNRLPVNKPVQKQNNLKNTHLSKDGVLVHGFFLYECEKCRAVYEMYLEKGLEDSVQDQQYPDKHKPVPFCIGCRVCNQGFAFHVMWGIGDSSEYEPLPEGASYFKNTPKEDCGKPVINQHYSDRECWKRAFRSRRYGGVE